MPKPCKLESVPNRGIPLTFAETQPEYNKLPGLMSPDRTVVCFCWQFSWRERVKLLLTGKLWHRVAVFNSPLQPQSFDLDRPIEFTESNCA